jgi:hypothetical protein
MPRVSERTAGKTKDDRVRHCERCSDGIKSGERVYTWSFFRQPARWQHTTHGYPKQSQLTQSKMTTVYEAVEDADLSGAETTEDLQAVLQTVAESVREVAEEYERSAEAMGEAGSEMQERAGELESWADELESWEPSEEWDPDATEEDEDEPTPVDTETAGLEPGPPVHLSFLEEAQQKWGPSTLKVASVGIETRGAPGTSVVALTGVVTPAESELTEEQQARFDEWLETVRGEAKEVLDSCPV